MRIVVATDAYVAVAFDVPVAEFLTSRNLARHRELNALGPDVLDDGFSPGAALERIRSRRDEPIADALLNQRVIAGVGNVFKSEALFVAGVDPFRPVSTLTDEELTRVIEAAQSLMRANVFRGGRRTTRMMDPAARLWVYAGPAGRAGAAARPSSRASTVRTRGGLTGALGVSGDGRRQAPPL